MASETPSNPDPPRRSGGLIAGRFRVEAQLGAGGMGTVYRCMDEQTSRPVALKLLRVAREATDAQRRRFLREGRALVGLQHPNIVRLLDCGEEDGLLYLALELVEGEDLEQRLRRGPLPAKEAAGLVRLLALALQHVHDAGVVHRDLKPANVLLRADGDPVLTDFGLVTAPGDESLTLTKSGCGLGTPGYWSPEQAAGRPDDVGPHSDVFGLGGVLYATLTGLPPFRFDNLIEATMAVLKQDPTPPSQLSDGIPSGLDAVCLRCLAREPEKRYPSASAVAAALAPFSSDAPPPRRRLAPVAAGGALVLGGALALLLPWGSEPPPAQAAPGPADPLTPEPAPRKTLRAKPERVKPQPPPGEPREPRAALPAFVSAGDVAVVLHLVDDWDDVQEADLPSLRAAGSLLIAEGQNLNSLLGLLKRSGVPGARRLIVDLYVECEDWFQVATFRRALEGIQDPRLEALVTQRLVESQAAGAPRSAASQYLELVAEHGGERGVQLLLAEFDAPEPMSDALFEAIAHSKDPRLLEPALRLARRPDAYADERQMRILFGTYRAKARDPLLEFAFDVRLTEDLREGAANVLAEHGPLEELPALVARALAQRDPTPLIGVAEGVGARTEDEDDPVAASGLSAAAVDELTTRVLSLALAPGSFTARDAATLLGSYPLFHTVAARDALRRVAQEQPAGSEREDLLEAAAAMDETFDERRERREDER